MLLTGLLLLALVKTSGCGGSGGNIVTERPTTGADDAGAVTVPVAGAATGSCGGSLTSERGLLSSPGFPRPFPVPIRCLWLISSGSPSASVAVHLTQLYVSAGLTFTEYAYYEPTNTAFQLEPRLVHRVTEENVANSSLVVTSRPFLVVEFSLDRLEGNHLRALDGLLDVFGFNLTYSIQTDALHLPDFSCSVAKCSLLGNCYATQDYSSFYCDCFPGYSGSDCSRGPLCQPDTNLCLNSATCRHVGAQDTACDCRPGYGGPRCGRITPLHDCRDEEVRCSRQCPFDGSRESACSCHKNGSPPALEMAHFESTLRLINVSIPVEGTRSLEAKLQKQMTKYLRSSNLSRLEEAKVLNISGSGETRFHFLGPRKEGGRVRELLLALVERGRLADFPLQQTQFSFKQEPTLLILDVRTDRKEGRVRTGEGFRVSCSVQGSSGLRFNWFKDGLPLNLSLATRKMSLWSEHGPGEQHTSHLQVGSAHPLDEGEFTCQAVDWGRQECRSVRLSVVQPLQVIVAPMTSTVQKGSNLTIRCFTSNKPSGRKLGYNWTKNKALFPMLPGQEFWEDLYPDGSILKLMNIQKGGLLTCSAGAGSWTGSGSSRLDVVDSPLAGSRCPGSGVWPPTAPGLQASAPCPPGYSGTALRLCLLLEPGHGRWQVPDYSACRSLHTIAITNAFLSLGLGYEGTSVGRTVWEIARTVGSSGRGSEGRGAYPGEAEPLVSLLGRVLGYITSRSDAGTLLNTTDNFIVALNGLLGRKSSIVNYQTLLSLLDTAERWALWYGRATGGTWGHVHQGGLLLNTLRVNPLQRRLQVSVPRPGFSSPKWLTGRLELELENRGLQNDSVLAVLLYRDLRNFFPKHFSQKLEDGRDVEFGVDGPVVSIAVSPGLEVSCLLQSSTAPAGLCGSTRTGQSWELAACNLTTRGCLCRGSGIFAVLASTSDLLKKRGEQWRSSLRVKVGCSCALVQAVVTGLLLVARYYRRPSCLLFLKIQSCASLAGAMGIFLLAASDRIDQEWYGASCRTLQLLLLIAVSSQLAKLVIVYSELLKIPIVRYFKQTVVIILTGLCGVCCLGSGLLETYSSTEERWWWLRLGSPGFWVVVVYTGGLLTMELAVGVDLICKMSKRISSSKVKTSLKTRAGLVKRSCLLLLLTVLMGSTSVLYANSPTPAFQNAFSISSGALGFALFTVYIVMSETKPTNVLFLKRIKDLVADEIYSSTSDNSFFTKQEAEAECEGGAPPDITTSTTPAVSLPMQTTCCSGLAESQQQQQMQQQQMQQQQMQQQQQTQQQPRGALQEDDLPPPSCRSGSTGGKPSTPRKCVSFHSDLVTGCKVIEDCGGLDEGSNGSPEPSKGSNLVRASYYQNPSTDPAMGHLQEIMTTRVCLELGLLQDSGQSPPTLMVCNVDIEPSSRLVPLPPSAAGGPPGQMKELQPGPSSSSCYAPAASSQPPPPQGILRDSAKTDVLHRISHDLDYLLNEGASNSEEETQTTL